MGQFFNENDAEYLYYKLEAIEQELFSTDDPAIADVLCNMHEQIKKQIEAQNNKIYKEKAEQRIIAKRDARIPAFKGRRAQHKFGIVFAVVASVAVICGIAFAVYTSIQTQKKNNYDSAIAAMESEDYATALAGFNELGTYEKSEYYAGYCTVCQELIVMEKNEEPVTISQIKGKLNELDKYDMNRDFPSLREIVAFAETFYGTEWEGGGYSDSVSREKFVLGVRIDSNGGIRATSFRADGYLVDATWSYADGYTMVYKDGQLYGRDNKYNEYYEILFFEDHLEYYALSRLSKEESTVYKK